MRLILAEPRVESSNTKIQAQLEFIKTYFRGRSEGRLDRGKLELWVKVICEALRVRSLRDRLLELFRAGVQTGERSFIAVFLERSARRCRAT
jgi:hypothetical protein